MRAGLIPSRALQERRIILEREQKGKSDEDNTSASIGFYSIKQFACLTRFAAINYNSFC